MAHLHDVIDDDLHFIIDPDTRKIRRTSENPIVLVQNDHNSERLTFEIPKVIDGHDMELCNRVRIHFLNVDAVNTADQYAGVYESTDLDVLEDDDETLVFTWLVSKFSTGHAGPLSFAISFQCTSEKTEANGSTSTVIDYSWNTLPDTDDVAVSNGMDNSNKIIDYYYDVVDTWLDTIYNMGEAAKAEITTHTDSVKLAMQTSINDFADEVKEEIARQTLADTDFVVQTTGTATNKVMSQDATTKAVASANTFASAKVAEVRAEVNGRVTAIEEILNNGGMLYKKIDPVVNGMYKLERGKKYHIYPCPNAGTNGREWDVTLQHILQGWSIQDTNGETITRTDQTKTLELINYFNQSPYIYGFEIRVVDDGSCRVSRNTSGKIYLSSSLKCEFMYGWYRDEDVNEDFFSVDINAGTLTGDRDVYEDTIQYTYNGLYLTSAGDVYEVAEGPLDGVGLSVDANGISNISKTATSGLTDTYTIVLDDGTTKTFTVKNGDGIQSVTTTDENDYETTYCITFDSGTTFSYKAPNANSIGIKTPASGAVIHAEDVIPVSHRVNVKVSGDVDLSTVKLTRCGKNLVDMNKIGPVSIDDAVKVEGNSVTITAGSKYGIKVLPKTIPLSSGGVYLKAGEPYTFTYTPVGTSLDNIYGWTLYAIDNPVPIYLGTATNVTYTPVTDIEYVNLLVSSPGTATTADIVLSNIQIEKGSVVTAYEPYSGAEYSIYSNGQPTTTVTSVSPKMTLFADKPGVVIDAVYNMDQTAAYNKFADNAAAYAEAKIDEKLAELTAALDEFLNGDA